jgi:hypothetical protein
VKGKHSWTTNQTIIINKAKKKEDLRYYTKKLRILITPNHDRIQQVNQTRSSRSERVRFTTLLRSD